MRQLPEDVTTQLYRNLTGTEAFMIDPSVSLVELTDEMRERTLQAHALAVAMSGDEFSTFNDEIQSNYIWCLYRTLENVIGLQNRMIEVEMEEGTRKRLRLQPSS